ncbi:PAS domain S-box protein [Curvibacter sp. RS43]|uniref:PAS domain S-box protein n=1 Tax=Curvibacter microcysteis TaxID=3026419 RepID=UPI002362DF71|nr:PAS domain S-box protein [Curvibacter sp. RS43]MDD0812504.1 PAS domain S-box protein [Curvibacter sp. RS43]
MTAHRPTPASCVVQLDVPSAHYEMPQACATWRRVLPVPPQGELLSAWRAAGLPPLCATRLLHVLRQGRAAVWPIELPSPQADGRLEGYLLSVSPLAGEADSPQRCSIVTLVPNHTPWPTGGQPGQPAANGLRLSLALDGELRLSLLDPQWTQLTGHATEACLGRPLTDFVHPQAQAGLTRHLGQAEQHPEVPRQRLPLLHQSGNLVWVEVDFEQQIAPTPDGRANGWWALLEDVSDNVRTWHLDQVREQALDQSNCGVVVTDATLTHQPIVYVNPRFTEITGYTLDEVRGRPCNFLQGEDRQQDSIAPLREAIQRGDRATALLRNYRKSGELFWNELHIAPIVDERSGILTHHVGIVNDVTETRHLLAQVSKQAEQLQSLHHDNPNGLIAFDEAGQVHLVNEAFVGLTGLKAQGLSRAAFWSALQAMADPGHEDLQQGLSQGQTLQWQIKRPKERVVEVRGSQLNAAGAPDLLVFRDVSAEVQLYRMQRQFLATAAHEMRAPMGSIRGFSELMLTRQFPPEVQRDLLERIHRQSGRLSDLLNDLLNLARIESQAPGSLPLEPVELQPLLHEVVRSFERPGADSRLSLSLAPAAVWVQAQRAKLEQVLVNLVSNALKYSSARGLPVHIGLQPGHDPQHWSVNISDQGVGMSAQTLERLFTKFFRVDPNGDIEGTGLGLCIAKELTERMGGSIQVSSQLGQGSVFTVNLLQTPSGTARPDMATAPAREAPCP